MSLQLAVTQAEFEQNNNFDYSYWINQYPWLADSVSIDNKLFAVCSSYGSFPPTQNYLKQFYIVDMENKNFVPDPNFEAIYESLLDYFIQNYGYVATNTATADPNLQQGTAPIVGGTGLSNFINAIPTGISKTIDQGEAAVSSVVDSVESSFGTIGLYLLGAAIVVACFYLFLNKK